MEEKKKQETVTQEHAAEIEKMNEAEKHRPQVLNEEDLDSVNGGGLLDFMKCRCETCGKEFNLIEYAAHRLSGCESNHD